MDNVKTASGKTIERVSIYRRLLRNAKADGQSAIYSHDLADMVGGTAAQVRRDLMEVGCAGNSKKGYDIDKLIGAIGEFLDHPEEEKVALVGVGNLGRALLQFFASHHPNIKIVAAFDSDPAKAGRVIHGCRCYDIAQLKEVVSEEGIGVSILAVPHEAAQLTAKILDEAGVKGILNFGPEPLRVSRGVPVENMDMSTALEKVAYLARQTNA